MTRGWALWLCRGVCMAKLRLISHIRDLVIALAFCILAHMICGHKILATLPALSLNVGTNALSATLGDTIAHCTDTAQFLRNITCTFDQLVASLTWFEFRLRKSQTQKKQL